MPEAKVYQCDKLEGLREKHGEPHKKCGHEVGEGGVRLALMIADVQKKLEEIDPVVELQFCSRRHAQYWLIRQRVALDA